VKALLKSSYTLIVASLAFFVAVLVFSSLITSVAMFQGITQSLATTVKWEGIMANETTFSQKPVSLKTAINDVEELAKRVEEAHEALMSDSRVNDSVTYFAITFTPPSQGSNPSSECPELIDLMSSVGVLVVSGINLNDSYVIWYPHAGQGYATRVYVSGGPQPINWTFVRAVLGITPRLPSPEVSKVLNDIVTPRSP